MQTLPTAARVSTLTLDGIRGLLALMVCFAHSWQILINPQYGPFHWDHAILGLSARYAVDAFYVLSGWVICQSIQTNIQKNTYFAARDWAENRFFRISIPLFASILITSFIWLFIRVTHLDQTPTEFGLARIKFSYRLHEVLLGIITLGFKGDLTGGMNGPLWSLSIEIQLYFLSFLFFWLLPKNRFLAYAVVAVALYRCTLEPNNLLGYGAFTLGFLGSLYASRDYHSPRILRCLRYFGLLIFSGAIFAMLFSFHLDPKYLDELARWPSIFVQLVFAAGFALFLCGAPKFENKYLAQSGNFSYTLYILHFPLLLLLSYALYKYTMWMTNPVVAWSIWLLGALLTILISGKIGMHIEKPKLQKSWVHQQLKSYRAKRGLV